MTSEVLTSMEAFGHRLELGRGLDRGRRIVEMRCTACGISWRLEERVDQKVTDVAIARLFLAHAFTTPTP